MSLWNQIEAHYANLKPELDEEESNEWACDPYAWAACGISMTPIETWLWHDIRALDLVLYPQFPIAGFFVDFANPKAKVAIECDGAAFHQDRAKDYLRDEKLKALGWSIYRISGKDCRDGVNSENEAHSKARQFLNEIVQYDRIVRN